MNALTHTAIRRPTFVIVLAALVTFSVAPGLPRLRLRTDGHALIPDRAPEMQADRKIRDEFGIVDPIVVYIQSSHPEGIFNSHSLQFIHDLTRAAEQLPGVAPETITSLATEAGFRHRPDTLRFATLLDPLPATDSEARQVRDDVRRIQLYTGSIVSSDEKSTAVYIGTPVGCDRPAFFREVSAAIAKLLPPDADEVHVIGAPVAEALLGLHILEDLGVPARFLGTTTFADRKPPAWTLPASLHDWRQLLARRIGLLPVTLLLMTAVFVACFRKAVTAAIPMIEVGGCLFFLFGLMGLCDIPVYLTIAVVPIILMAQGVCDEIHILSHFRRCVAARPERVFSRALRAEIVRDVMDEMIGPVVRTSVTTAVGFASFIWAPIEPVRMFGILTTIGVAFCMIWSLTVMPAMLVLIDPRRLVPLNHKSSTALDRSAGLESTAPRSGALFDRLAAFLIARRSRAMVGILVAVGIAMIGIRHVKVQDSWIDGFDPQSEFRRATADFDRHFFGAHVLHLCVDASARPFSYTLSSDELHNRHYPLPLKLPRSADDLIGDRFTISGRLPPLTTTAPTSRPGSQFWRSSVLSVDQNEDRSFVVTPAYDGLPIYWLQIKPPLDVQADVGFRPLCSPRVIDAIRSLAEFARERKRYAVGGVLGAAEFIATTSFMLAPDNPDSRKIPNDVVEIESLWSKYAYVRGPERVRQLVNRDETRTLTTLYLRAANFIDTAALMSDIRRFEKETLAPRSMKLEFAGDVAVSQALIAGIVSTQLQSLVFSLLGVFAVTVIMGRSFLYGFYCVLPCALSLPLVFAAMGWLGIPLGVATSMFAAMIIGTGVDFAIHVLDRFRLTRKRTTDSVNTLPTDRPSAADAQDAAIRDSLAFTGFPVCVNALSLSAGLLVLTLSQVPANARLGVLLAFGLISCLLVSLTLLPVLLKWRPLDPAR